jgi:CheY-like chemotaxis protein
MRTFDESSQPIHIFSGMLSQDLKTKLRRGPIEMNVVQHIILCVDDEPVGLEVRKMLLERAGYQVLTALDGPAGLEIFAHQPVEAVVLDYSMPGMNGGEVAGFMRAIKPSVPILMLSAYTSLPPEVHEFVTLTMTKGEGAPALLTKLGSLLGKNASQ